MGHPVLRHIRSPLGTFSTPDTRFDHVHIDLVGPLHPSDSNTCLCTCIDHFTRWLVAITIPDQAAEMEAQAFISHWATVFSAPSTITRDWGHQFESALLQAL